LIDRARTQGPLLLVDTGNLFSMPYVLSRQGNRAKESYVAQFYRTEGYQAVALGWGDFRVLEEGIARDLPWVSANARAPGVKPYRLVKVGPWKVAITAITGKGSFSSPMEWEAPRDALSRVLKEMSREKADVLLLLVASPSSSDILDSQGVQVILGGVYGRGKIEKEKPPYVVWLSKARGGEVAMVTLEKTDQGVRLVSFQTYVLDSRVPGDPKVAREIQNLLK
jgi:2',3'-cyclic-nucleotide 2'-phosphodiesterase (5'-nucleotidase family)